MKTLENTTFNESTDAFQPIVAGTYPAHITSFESREINDSIVFNVTFKLADKVGEMEVPVYVNIDGKYEQSLDEKGEAVTRKATHLVGKEIRSAGVWLTPNPKEGEGWKNRKYKEFFENVGVSFPVDDNGNVTLGEVEEEDVLGYPCLAKVGEQSFTNKEGEEKVTMRVFNTFPWNSGQKLSADEIGDDVPF
tara:strand:- start:716 stop:1291 length:576 start_codon:yes stop_codon:yes gene_type:complete